jgi:hypothetical protein
MKLKARKVLSISVLFGEFEAKTCLYLNLFYGGSSRFFSLLYSTLLLYQAEERRRGAVQVNDNKMLAKKVLSDL